MDANEVRVLLQRRINESGKPVSKIAWEIGCDATGINKVLAGTVPPRGKLLKWLGVRKVVSFEVIPAPSPSEG